MIGKDISTRAIDSNSESQAGLPRRNWVGRFAKPFSMLLEDMINAGLKLLIGSVLIYLLAELSSLDFVSNRFDDAMS